MAVIYSTIRNNRRYEIRTAGSSTRLYTNGVFHSQFNPRHSSHGSVWDLLCLPALLQQPEKINNVLLLGVGGGAIIRMLEQHLSCARFVGIELDAVHIHLAIKYFGLREENCQLVHANAVEWVRNHPHLKFDLVIDDLFSDTDGVAVRAVNANAGWLNQLSSLLNEDGTLVCNFASAKEYRRSPFAHLQTARQPALGYSLSHEYLDNIVAVMTRDKDAKPVKQQDIVKVYGIKRAQPVSVRSIRAKRR